MDLNMMLDQERKMRFDAFEEVKNTKKQVELISQILNREVKLKEMFEDKLKEILDTRSRDPSSQKAQDERIRQRETKRILQGFEVELSSVLYQR